MAVMVGKFEIISAAKISQKAAARNGARPFFLYPYLA
jgi:hypothetical protein